SSSPARMLVWEQYPSIHGQRYFVLGSILVLLSIQSLVPCCSFSSSRRWAVPTLRDEQPTSAVAWAAIALLINSRRLNLVFISLGPPFHYYFRHATPLARCDTWRGDSQGISGHHRNPLWLFGQV